MLGGREFSGRQPTAMVNIFLIVVMVVMIFLILVASFYTLVHYQSEEDDNTAYAPKIVVVFGLTLTALIIMMLPLDVANRSSNGGIPMSLLWLIMYITMAVMIVIVVPFTMFYYEAYDPESRNWQIWTAFKYEVCTILICGLTLGILWAFVGFAEVPLDVFSQNGTYSETELLLPATASNDCGPLCVSTYEETNLRISVTLAVYIVALLAFVGWFLFTIFTGVGLVALPMDLIHEYARRPQPLDLEEYAKQRMLLNERATQLQQVAAKLGPSAHRKKDTRGRRQYNQFKQAVFFLEKDWKKVKTAYKERGGNPLVWMAQALGGLLGIGLSITWYVHIVVYTFLSPPPTTCLNFAFEQLDNVFPLFGTSLYALFAFYLLFCVVKGCMKVGMRFFCIPIHPMRIGETMMNSFLFNVWLLLLCAVACVQFCFQSFQAYAQLTDAELLLGVQVRNLQGLSVFFRNNIFIYTMFGVSMISLLYLCIFPHDKPAIDDDDDIN